LSFLLSLFMLTDLMATDWRFSCVVLALMHPTPPSRRTYNVDATVDLCEAALANVLHALELANGLLRRRGR
jgi:hypothetical protein